MKKWQLATLLAVVAAAMVLMIVVSQKKGEIPGPTVGGQETVAGNSKAMELYSEGKLRMAEEDFEGAIEALLASLELDESNPAVYQELSNAYFGLAEYEQMEQILVQGYEATGDFALEEARVTALRAISDQLLFEEDYENAVLWLTKLITSAGEEEELLRSLGTCYYMLDDYKNAVETFEKADTSDEEVKKTLIEAKIRYGELCYEESNYEEAKKQLKAAMELDPNAIEAYTLLLTVHMDEGTMDEANAVVEAGMERFLAPDAGDYGDYLDSFLGVASSYYTETENMEACLSFWQKVVSLRPDNETFKEELESYQSLAADEAYIKAEELMEAGDRNGASAYFKRAFSLAPENFDPGILMLDEGTYCLNSDGSWKTGWYEDEVGGRYYFDPSTGKAVTGFKSLDGSEYYFEEDGLMLRDDETPDGRYAAMDGKISDMPADEEETEETYEEETEEESFEEEPEETEEETFPEEPEESLSEEDDNNVIYDSGVQIVRPDGGSGNGGYSQNGPLKLNADTLDSVKKSGKTQTLKRDELFYGGGESLDMEAVFDCLNQYSIRAEWKSMQEPYEISMGDMNVRIYPGDDWDTEDHEEYGGSPLEAFKQRELPEDVTFEVEFTGEAGKTKVIVDKIRRQNQ